MKIFLVCLSAVVMVIFVAFVIQGANYHKASSCGDCHVMHASKDNSEAAYNAGAGYDYLLIKSTTNDLCLYCHDKDAGGGWTSQTPYVAGVKNSDTIAGGTFDRFGADAVFVADSNDTYRHNLGKRHQVAGDCPGGGDKDWTDTTSTAATQGFKCTLCHAQHGSLNYRNLLTKPNPDQTWAITDGEVTATATGYSDPQITYKDKMEKFCQQCHEKFALNSGAGGYDNDGFNQNTSPYNHHPVEKALTAGIRANWLADSDSAVIKLQDGADNTAGNADDSVFCLSCHRAHGSDKAYALRLDEQTAAAPLCQACHNK